MDTQRLCPSCQQPLAPDVPLGLCPQCLVKAGFPTGAETETGSVRRPAFVPPPAESLAGLFPQLEIVELIGQGGMGAIYKARQKQLNRLVALKILPPDIGREPAFAERFTREAQALARLNHPNIVTLYEFGQASGQFYFLMEYVDGVNLRQLLANGRVSPREALAIVPQICDALQYAHDQGIVHRDIKPENILLDRKGRVKVADFGLAKIMGADGDAANRARAAGPAGLTNAGKILGTPNYMAPEQAAHPDEVDHRVDIYALGVVLYQMLTGELPGNTIEPPSKKVQVDVRLDEVVLRALEKKPELRFQQVSEVKTMVETIVAQPPDPVAGASQLRSDTDTKKPKTYTMKTKIILVTIIFLLGAALAFEAIENNNLKQRLQSGQSQPAMTFSQQKLHAKFEQRSAEDKKNYTQAQLQEAEQLYQVANHKWGTPEAMESLRTMIKKYPNIDRTGCATLYLAQMTQGEERAKCLQDCMDEYNDCFYGDGVQVGALARFFLVQDYRSQGNTQKAEELANEIKTKYPTAIDHGGHLLTESLPAAAK
jgi:serine/threonine protein kinase